jgi:hypothetical protein
VKHARGINRCPGLGEITVLIPAEKAIRIRKLLNGCSGIPEKFGL